jgi:carbon-monoxide dehydrogenase medium subunit
VKAPDVAYLRADSLEHALQALALHGDAAAVLAGGQSLMAMLNLRVAAADVLVDINRVPGLSSIREEGDCLAIGALSRYSDLLASPLLREHLPLLVQALPHVAHEAVRNRGTLGGSLALADPAAEMPACCLALGARLRLAGPAGRREVAIEDWFRGLYETALAPGELIVEVVIPKSPMDAIVHFCELARRRGDFAIAGLALVAGLHDGVLHAPRIALLGVADRPLLAQRLMQAVAGRPPAGFEHAEIARLLDADMDPLDDPSVPADYRRHAMAVLARRALVSIGISSAAGGA